MKLYRKADGEIVGTQALAGKGHTAIYVPVDKQGLIAWLNEEQASGPVPPGIWPSDPITTELLEGPSERLIEPIISAPKGTYSSPLDARTTIAGIDAGMCASAIRQMDGANLAKVVGASIERMADLSAALPLDEDLLG